MPLHIFVRTHNLKQLVALGDEVRYSLLQLQNESLLLSEGLAFIATSSLDFALKDLRKVREACHQLVELWMPLKVRAAREVRGVRVGAHSARRRRRGLPVGFATPVVN